MGDYRPRMEGQILFIDADSSGYGMYVAVDIDGTLTWKETKTGLHTAIQGLAGNGIPRLTTSGTLTLD